MHPSYAEGHGVIAGARVTALKALFNESFAIPNPVIASDAGQARCPTPAPPRGRSPWAANSIN